VRVFEPPCAGRDLLNLTRTMNLPPARSD